MRAFRRATVVAAMALLALATTSCLVPAPSASDLVTAKIPSSGVPAANYIATGTPGNPDPVYDPVHGLQARVYTPTTPPPASGLRPAIVYVHGGGWITPIQPGDLAGINSGITCIQYFCTWGGEAVMAQVTRGWVVINIDYRPDVNYPPNQGQATPANPFPAALQDVKTAVRWVKSQPGIDTNDVVIAGGSAGGTLATMVALTPGSFEPPGTTGQTTVRAAVNLDGPNNLRNLYDTSFTGGLGLTCNQTPPALPDPLCTIFGFGTGIPFYNLVPLYLGCGLTDTNCIYQNIDNASPSHWVNPNSPPIYFACSTQPPLTPKLGCIDAQSMANSLTSITNDPEAAFLDEAPNGNHYNMDQTLNFTVLNKFLDMPGTSVVIPSSNTSLNGHQALLDAGATANSSVTKVEFHLTGGSLNGALIATATPTYYGWLAFWDTTTVPDGTYTLQSAAFDGSGNVGVSDGVTITVNN
jgi:acetyl esterase/lipase